MQLVFAEISILLVIHPKESNLNKCKTLTILMTLILQEYHKRELATSTNQRVNSQDDVQLPYSLNMTTT